MLGEINAPWELIPGEFHQTKSHSLSFTNIVSTNPRGRKGIMKRYPPSGPLPLELGREGPMGGEGQGSLSYPCFFWGGEPP